MVIRNGLIYSAKCEFVKGNIRIENGIITGVQYNDTCIKKEEMSDDMVIDAEGMYVIPGLVDIHLHGCAGHDFCEGNADSFDAIVEYELKNGITTIIPATMTLPECELDRILHAAGDYIDAHSTVMRGITMEGPFISVEKKGAQSEESICRPDIDMFRKFQKLSHNNIKQVVVAPERDTAMEFIREVSKETVVSVAHTMSDYDTADRAFKSGATHVTHLFNAMPSFGHRQPAVVGAAFDNEAVYVELIGDGVHVHPSMVRAVFKLFGSYRICMISDSMMATGLSDGDYTLGGQAVRVSGSLATLENGTIAGSVTNLYEAMKKVVFEMGVTLEQAVQACTRTPAKALGLEKMCGLIARGRAADLVISDKRLNIKYVIKNGEVLDYVG